MITTQQLSERLLEHMIATQVPIESASRATEIALDSYEIYQEMQKKIREKIREK